MLEQTFFVTRDGVLHKSKKAADEHLDNKAMSLVAKVAHQLVKTDGKYVKILQVLRDNFEVFQQVQALLADMAVENAWEEGDASDE